MGDLAADTAVEQVDEGRWRARLSPDWNVWGPNGGYVASVCLRAAGAASGLALPATIACHYLAIAEFDDVDLDVRVLRATKRTSAVHVHMRQGERPVADATVWAVADGLDGYAWDATVAPDVPPPAEVATNEAGPGSHAMSRNLEQKRIPNPERRHEAATWMRFVPAATFADPWVDACRSLILLDTWAWPAAIGGLADEEHGRFLAPNLDVTARFHADASGSEWLLADARAPYADRGLIGTEVRVWTDDGRLAASGGAQLFCRPGPKGP